MLPAPPKTKWRPQAAARSNAGAIPNSDFLLSAKDKVSKISEREIVCFYKISALHKKSAQRGSELFYKLIFPPTNLHILWRNSWRK